MQRQVPLFLIYSTRQDFLHKLSRKLVDKSQVIVVENLNLKGMVRNRKLSKSISDVGWGMLVNFLAYKLERKEGSLIEIDRFFPSSKKCSCCGHVMDELPLDIRELGFILKGILDFHLDFIFF